MLDPGNQVITGKVGFIYVTHCVKMYKVICEVIH